MKIVLKFLVVLVSCLCLLVGVLRDVVLGVLVLLVVERMLFESGVILLLFLF